MRELRSSELAFVAAGFLDSNTVNITQGSPGSSVGKVALNRGIGGVGGWGFQKGATGGTTNGTVGFNGGTGTPGAGGQASVS